MGNSADDRRLANDRANKEAMARELAKANDRHSQREAERQRNEVRGIKAEQGHRAGKDPGRPRS